MTHEKAGLESEEAIQAVDIQVELVGPEGVYHAVRGICREHPGYDEGDCG